MSRLLGTRPRNEVHTEIVQVYYPHGFVVRRMVDRTAWYLNQSRGDWAAFATVYLNYDVAAMARDAWYRKQFTLFNTVEIAEGSD